MNKLSSFYSAITLSVSSLAAAADPESYAQKYETTMHDRAIKLCKWQLVNKPPAGVPDHGLCGNAAAAMNGAAIQERIEKFFGTWDAIDSKSDAYTRLIIGEDLDNPQAKAARHVLNDATLTANIRSAPETDICAEFRESSSAVARAELLRRGLTAVELASVAKHTFRVGSRQRAMLCSMGKPDDVNRTVTASGEYVQFVFGDGVYVYTVNEVVTAFQD